MRYLSIKKILCSLAALLLASLGATWFFDNKIMYGSIMSRVERQFAEAPRDLDILFMGDSHIQEGLNPLKIEGSFNYSNATESYIQIYYKLKYLLEHDVKRFKVLVLQLDYHNFSTMYFKERENVWYWKRYVDFFEIGRVKRQPFLYAWKWFRAHFASYFNEREAVLRFLKGSSEMVWQIEKGHMYAWGGVDDTEELFRHNAIARARAHLRGYDMMDPGILHYFRRTLDLCRQNGIKVVLIRLPITRLYYDQAAAYGAVDKVESLTREVLGQYPEVSFLDLHALYEDNIKYYADPDHLNPDGSDRLSEHIRPILSELVADARRSRTGG